MEDSKTVFQVVKWVRFIWVDAFYPSESVSLQMPAHQTTCHTVIHFFCKVTQYIEFIKRNCFARNNRAMNILIQITVEHFLSLPI